MEKVYKAKPIKILTDSILYLLAFALLWIVCNLFFQRYILYVTVGVIILLILRIIGSISDIKMKITVNKDTLTITKKNKTVEYNLNECSFESKVTNNSDFRLTVINKEGTRTYYDCSYLGYNQYMELLEDLKVVGDEQKPIELVTKKKEK